MLMSRETFEYIVERQKELDKAFLGNARWMPNYTHRELAIIAERGEFFNEFANEIKWWKHKENNVKNILNECIDAWHFGAQFVYQDFEDTEHQRSKLYDMISDEVERYREKVKDAEEHLKVHALLPILGKRANDWISILAVETLILELMHYTDDDMRQSYDDMNAKNYQRIAQGY